MLKIKEINMNSSLKFILVGVGSLGVGGVVGYFIAKKRYEALADKECESLIKKIEEQTSKLEDMKSTKPIKQKDKKEIKVTQNKPNFTDKKDYFDYSKLYRTNTQTDGETYEYATLITSSEFVQSTDNEQHTLIYYSDGVLADDDYNEIKDVKDYIGNIDLYKIFVESEDCTDAIYIRNAKLKQDFEIIFDERSFSELIGKYKNLNREVYDNN